VVRSVLLDKDYQMLIIDTPLPLQRQKESPCQDKHRHRRLRLGKMLLKISSSLIVLPCKQILQ